MLHNPNTANAGAGCADMEHPPTTGFDLDALARAGTGGAWQPAPPLPLQPSSPRRRLSICVASHDLVGPIRNGGIGTAYTALAEALAADGHQVTALYLRGRRCEQGTFASWMTWYRERGVELVPLPPAPISLANSENVKTAYDAFHWLRNRSFDVVHFPEMQGLAYFCLLARRQGLAFARTLFVIGTHSPTAWHKQGNQEMLDRYEELEIDFLERRCLELADVAWSPSQYLLRWERDRDWKLPTRTYVQPYLVPAVLGAAAIQPVETVREIVFFGRLEERKGLVLFCDALEKLSAQIPSAVQGLQVTFLGKERTVRGLPSVRYLAEARKHFAFATRVITDKNRFEAVEYLRGTGRLAVMPSLMENLPFTVLECLREGIPFLASTAGGIPELIAADQHARLLIPLRADLWMAALARVLTEGAERGRLAFDPEANRAAWLDWHAQLPLLFPSRDRQGADEIPPFPDGRGSEKAKPERQPLVSVCMPHHNRPQLLAQALESLRQQDYPNLEVVLVDDASTDADALAYLDQLAPEFARRGWQIARLPANRYAAGARNAAARLARGEYLLFMDDDNVAKPQEVSTFVRVAQRTGADLVGCFVDIVEGPALPGPDSAVSCYAFLGPALALGLWRNALGDTNSLMRREVFVALGGFTEDYGVSNEDHEFMVRAVLRGFRLEMIPEALFWYRRTPNSVNHSADPVANVLRALRPYLDVVPPELRPALQLAQGLMGQEIAPEKWRSRPVRYRAVDWLVATLERQPRAFALARSLLRWGLRLWNGSRPFSSQPAIQPPARGEPRTRAA